MVGANPPSNNAAWMKKAKSDSLTLDEAPYTKPQSGQLVVKNAVVAVNASDWKIQERAGGLQLKTEYPFILGEDIAGEVEEVGPGVDRFKKGDRIISYALSVVLSDSTRGGFQSFTIVDEFVTAPIPDWMSFESASVLPLAVSTAAAGLYQHEHLFLPFPTRSPVPAGKTLLVWGAAGSVGSAAVQLAVASGLNVIATVSPKNFAYAKELGATEVVDYTPATVLDDVLAAVKKIGGEFVGCFDAVGKGGWKPVVHKLGGGKVATVLAPPTDLPDNIEATAVFAGSIATTHREIANAVWRDFLPEALADGRLKAKPDPIVIHGGLGKIQEGLDRLKQGVSAAKIVVKL